MGPGPGRRWGVVRATRTAWILSVNAAYVEAPYSSAPILHTRSAGNVAGGFNGGGTGNKAILGFKVGAGLPLGSLLGVQWTWRDLNVQPSAALCFANLVLDVNGNGTAYKIGVVDPSSLAALNNGTTVTNGDGSKTTTWLAVSMNLLIVGDLPVPPLPPGGPGFIAPDVNLGGPLGTGWPSHSYSVATILGAYPSAKFGQAATGDGGLPKSPNETPAFMLVGGDSANQSVRAFRLTDVSFNGAPA